MNEQYYNYITEMRRSSSGEKKNKRKSKTAPSLELGSLREQLSEGSLLTVGSSGSIHNNNNNTQPKKSPKDSNEDKSPKPSDPLAHHSSKKSNEGTYYLMPSYSTITVPPNA